MIEYDVQQGSPEWVKLRLGIVTASQFDRILTPKKLKLAEGRDTYSSELIAEWWTGEPADGASSGFMERGTKIEQEARDWYAFERSVDVRQVGFITTDDARVGCSPDGMVDPDGGLELKVPAAKTHVAYLRNPATLAADYRMQVQGCLWVTGRKWWDVASYNPAMHGVIVRCEPDTEFQAAFGPALAVFLDELESAKRACRMVQTEATT